MALWPLIPRMRISIHALREEGDRTAVAQFICVLISIHALREEGDFPEGGQWVDFYISIHALREEGDVVDVIHGLLPVIISIHALREEGDLSLYTLGLYRGYFYPRPPRGGRQQKQRQNLYFQTNYTTFCTNLEEP